MVNDFVILDDDWSVEERLYPLYLFGEWRKYLYRAN